MKKVELLAPAGNYEAFLGAVHAGADAVYLGGSKYSARAFADNFDEETLCKAISYAHLFGRKVYLTMNTLVKQSELEEAYSFLKPFYLEGLDGVIVQDIGLFSYIRKHFPLLEIHISTQMAITGPYGSRSLKELGAARVVPARELSLEEMKLIKKEGLEVETFIHGAMCYCYSGQCFFSSMLGGRSGNRGKCAQSCRLPYKVNLPREKKGKEEEYPLSLKDMCSIEHLPQLIEAGIDSFKIEGRMKRPEYAAGVTAIYRKYIDRYYETRCQRMDIEEEDWKQLSSLYIRSDIQDGYYFRHNGPEMVTLHKPSYSGTDDTLVERIRKEYIETALKAPVNGWISVKKGEPLTLILEAGGVTVTGYGPIVDQAMKKAVTREDVEKQLNKTGSTNFFFAHLEIEIEEDVFLPLKALNELRRETFGLLESELTQEVKKVRAESLYNIERNTINRIEANSFKREEKKEKEIDVEKKHLNITVTTREQCLKACTFSREISLYLSSDLLLKAEDEEIFSALKARSAGGGQVWVKLPEVLRARDLHYIDQILNAAQPFAVGMMISNMETYGYLKEKGYNGKLALNHHMYIWNQESMDFWREKAQLFSAPLECNKREWEKLEDERFSYLCYGRIPMMVTANCIRKTGRYCQKSEVSLAQSLTDRYGARLPVQVNCNYCFNIIYNSVPLSLHGYTDALQKLPGKYLRMDFTTETAEEMAKIVAEYEKALSHRSCDFSFLKEYTTGHYKKGAL